MKPILLLTAVLAAGAALAAQPDVSKLPPAAKKTGVTYATDIRPLFEASCFRCHTGDRAKAGLHLDTLEGVLKGTKDGKVIEAGHSEKSQLVIAVSRIDDETAMPPKKGPGGPGGPGGPRGPGGPGAAGGGSGGTAGGPGGGRGPGGPGGFAPPKPLTADQVGLIRAWVDQGAK